MFERKRCMTIVAVAVLSVSLWTSELRAQDTANELLDTIIAGIVHNDSLITNISFDYVVDYNRSDEWQVKRLEFYKKHLLKDVPEGMEIRIPDLEPTLRTGSAIFEGDKFKISSKWLFFSDREVFKDEIVTYDGTTLKELDLKGSAGNISDEIERRKSHLTFDPRNFPVLFVDGQPLYSALTDRDTTTRLTGKEEIGGTICYIIEMTENFTTPEGIQKQARKRCWIAPDKSYRIKKAILYGNNPFDGKPLTITQCELNEVTEGIWYYSKVTFESYPLSLSKPDVMEVLELKNIVVNQELKENAFTITFPAGCFIDDQVAGRRYRVGEE